MRPIYEQDDLDDCCDDIYPTSLREWFCGPDYLTDTLHGVAEAARDPLPHEERFVYPSLHAQQERERKDWQRRVILAEALIASELHDLGLHTADVSSWKQLLALGAAAADRQYGWGASVTWSGVLVDAARRQWDVIAASRMDALERAA